MITEEEDLDAMKPYHIVGEVKESVGAILITKVEDNNFFIRFYGNSGEKSTSFSNITGKDVIAIYKGWYE
jgi:hypothetical protein